MSLGPAFVKLAAARSALPIPVEGLSSHFGNDLNIPSASPGHIGIFLGRKDIDQLGEVPSVSAPPLIDALDPVLNHNGMSIGEFNPGSYSNNFFRRSEVEKSLLVSPDEITTFRAFKPDDFEKNFVRDLDSEDGETESDDEDEQAVKPNSGITILQKPAGPFDIGRVSRVFNRSPQIGEHGDSSVSQVASANFDIGRLMDSFSGRSEGDNLITHRAPLVSDRIKNFGFRPAANFDIGRFTNNFARTPIVQALDLDTFDKLLNIAPAASFRPDKYLGGFNRRGEPQAGGDAISSIDITKIANQDEKGPGLSGPFGIYGLYRSFPDKPRELLTGDEVLLVSRDLIKALERRGRKLEDGNLLELTRH
ncbi:hypothetical protein DL96DRAFT_1607046 [Flagelloscypha sp. PMI_526]|nr:hypothetical protein DL96DRAFT_1607046 [Flagelloscypha sp. PMI_526]